MDAYGWGLLKQGKIKEAVPLLKQAAQAMPDSPATQFHWASALAKSGRSVEAQAVLQKLLATQQRFSERGQAASLLKTIEAIHKG